MKDLETVSSGYYRAKAVLTNGVDVPITIEEREDNYIYVTLAPLSNLFD
ncbi:putative membrane protein [Pectobacterium actinidiae]|nr:putative membrane protein [Pectobacterium actinidiae]